MLILSIKKYIYIHLFILSHVYIYIYIFMHVCLKIDRGLPSYNIGEEIYNYWRIVKLRQK